MKEIRKKNEKNKKNPIRIGISSLIIVFFMITLLFQKEIPAQEFLFVRNADEAFVHNAAQQRDYLFQDEWGQTIYQGQIGTWTITGTNIVTSWTAQQTLENMISPEEIARILAETQSGQTITWIITTWTIYTWLIETWIQATGTEMIGLTWMIETEPMDCITPWDEKVKDKDFVLAYEQRKDVKIICNIEKRICNDGILWGSFSQSSCKETGEYIYRKAQAISYNQKILNEYIQPVAPINSWATFSTEGKINETQKPIDKRGTGNNPIKNQSGVSQLPSPSKTSCTTPRGQEIKHGQFIKAYKAPRGFIDLPCNVEIRACVNGNMKWNFRYAKCTFNNTIYSEYLKAWAPTSNTGFLFFQWIKWIVK